MDQVSRALLAVGGGADAKTYVDDVFSTYLYTGNGGTQTITNGLDLKNKGGLVWTKTRSNLNPSYGIDNWLTYSTSVPTGDSFAYLNNLRSNTSQEAFFSGSIIGSFNIDGYSIASAAYGFNINTEPYVSWSFRKAPKFFDVVTYTGDGSGSSRTLNHSLGSTPGLYVIKATSTTGDWYVGVPSLGVNYWINLNSNANAGNNTSYWQSATSTTFGPQNTGGTNILNVNGVSYVAYLFANDTSTDGLIQCGSFTTDGSGNATVTLNWEPQFLLVKASSVNGDWIMLDSMRGWNMTAQDARLLANTTAAETTAAETGNPTATGFSFSGGSASATYIYMAIRRPNKPPTTGTDVFNLGVTTVANGSSVTGVTSTSAANKVDAVIRAFRAGDAKNFEFFDRVRGFQSTSITTNDSFTSPRLSSNSTGTEVTTSTDVYQRSGTTFGEDFVAFASATTNTVNYALKRAPKFFDVVCYTGTGVARTVNHNLGVAPELMIVKGRTNALAWIIYHAALGNNASLSFSTSATNTPASSWNTTTPTASVFSLGAANAVNQNASTYVAYLFASLPGISKIGTYTGNGTSQTINCGFATGARFVLIKRTSAAGDWYVWDTARGIVAADDPHLSLNSTAVEVTTNDSIDPDNSGFIVNQVAATNINVTSAEYIYLAIA